MSANDDEKNVTPRSDDEDAAPGGTVFFMSDDEVDDSSANTTDTDKNDESGIDEDVAETDAETETETETDDTDDDDDEVPQQKLRVTDEIIRVTRPDGESAKSLSTSSGQQQQQQQMFQHVQGMLVGLLGAVARAKVGASKGQQLTRTRVKASVLASTVQRLLEGPASANRISATLEPSLLGVTLRPVIDARPVRLDEGAESSCTASSCEPGEVTTMAAYLERMHALRTSRDPPNQVALRMMQASAPYVTESQQAAPTRSVKDVDCYLACELPRRRAVRALGMDASGPVLHEYSYQGDPVHVVGVLVDVSNGGDNNNKEGPVQMFDARAYRNHVMSLKPGDVVSVHYASVTASESKLDKTPDAGLHATVVASSGDATALRVKLHDGRVLTLGTDTPPALVYGSSWTGPRLQKHALPSTGVAIISTGGDGDGDGDFEFIASHLLHAIVPSPVEAVALAMSSSKDDDDVLATVARLGGVSASDAYNMLLLDDALLRFAAALPPRKTKEKSTEPTAAGPSAPPKDAAADKSAQLLLAQFEASDFLGYDRVAIDEQYASISDSALARAMFLAGKGAHASDAHVLTRMDSLFDAQKSALVHIKEPPPPPPPLEVGDEPAPAPACHMSLLAASDSSLIGVSRLFRDLLSVPSEDKCAEFQLAQSHVLALDAPWAASPVSGALRKAAKAPLPQDARIWSLPPDSIRLMDEALARAGKARHALASEHAASAAREAAASLQQFASYVTRAADDRDDAKRVSELPSSHWLTACAAFLPEKHISAPSSAGVALLEESLESAIDFDFESMANYSRAAGVVDDDGPIDDDNESDQVKSGNAGVVDRFLRAVFSKHTADSTEVRDLFIRNVEYYNGEDVLVQQTRRQIQLVKLRRAELQKRVRLSGPKFEAFERDLIKNMRRRTEALHLVKTVQVCGALAILLGESNPARVKFNSPTLLASTNSTANAAARHASVVEHVIATTVDEGNLVLAALSGDERATPADVRKGVLASVEAIRRDKPGGRLVLEGDGDDSSGPGAAQQSGATNHDDELTPQTHVDWPGFRPSFDASRPSSRAEPAGSVHKVLHVIARKVDDAAPLMIGVDKKPLRMNACCMQALTTTYNIHAYLGAGAARRTAAIEAANKTASKVLPTVNLARLRKEEVSEATKIMTMIENQANVADIVSDAADTAQKATIQNRGAQDASGAAQLVVRAAEAIGDAKGLLTGLANGGPASAQDAKLSELAGALSERFDRLIVDVKADNVFGAAEGEAAAPADPDGIRAARERYVQVRGTYADYKDLSVSAAQFAGTSLRTLLGRIASSRGRSVVNGDDTQDDAMPQKKKQKEKKTQASRKAAMSDGIMNASWREHQRTCMLQLAQSSAGPEFQRRIKQIAAALPPSSAYAIQSEAHAGKGLYVSTLLATYVGFSAVAQAIRIGHEVKAPSTALQALVRAAMGLLSEVTALNAVHDDVKFKALTLEQLEASKKRKIGIYGKAVSAMDGDRELLRELRKIKGIDYDELDDKYDDPQQTTNKATDEDLVQPSSAVTEEDNYFVFDAAPGRVSDGYDGFDGQDLYNGGEIP